MLADERFKHDKEQREYTFLFPRFTIMDFEMIIEDMIAILCKYGDRYRKIKERPFYDTLYKYYHRLRKEYNGR